MRFVVNRQFALGIVLCLLIYSGAWGMGAELSKEEAEAELRIGRATAVAFIQSQVLLDAPELRQRVQEIADRLLQAAGSNRQYRVHIVNAPVVNALALPSGDILVYTGLLEELANVDELAIVLGHELSHVLNHDGFNRTKEIITTAKQVSAATHFLTTVIGSAASAAASKAVAAATMPAPVPAPGPRGAAVGGVLWHPEPAQLLGRAIALQVTSEASYRAAAGLSALVISSTAEVLLAGYGKEREQRADEEGLLLAKRAGFNLRAGATFLENIRKKWPKEKASATRGEE